MTRPWGQWVPAAVGAGAAVLLLVLALVVPLEVRHSAPFGFRLTLDTERSIAVPGTTVVANYPNFNRVDLDLRAFTEGDRYDLTVYVRPDDPGRPNAAPIRRIPLGVKGDDVDYRKPAFADPFTTVRFPPVADSAGRRYYVWVERGPATQDDIVTLWSIKSYSRVDGRTVLAALIDNPPGMLSRVGAWVLLGGALVGFAAATAWLVGVTTALTIAAARRVPARVGAAARAPRGPGGAKTAG